MPTNKQKVQAVADSCFDMRRLFQKDGLDDDYAWGAYEAYKSIEQLLGKILLEWKDDKVQNQRTG